MKKTMKTLVVLGASIVLFGSQVCFAGKTHTTRTTTQAQKQTLQSEGDMKRVKTQQRNITRHQNKTESGVTQQSGSVK